MKEINQKVTIREINYKVIIRENNSHQKKHQHAELNNMLLNSKWVNEEMKEKKLKIPADKLK